MYSPYHEDRLPEGQLPIHTTNVKKLLTCTMYLTDLDNPYPTIGVVTAPAGTGKTIAANVCQEAIERQFQSVLPSTLKIKVAPRSTSRILSTDLLEHMGERPRGDNSAQLTADAAKGIERNDKRLVIFDEGDRLNDDSFEVVRFLLDKTGCPILVIGLPSIWSVIERQEKFNSRVGLRTRFDPLPLQEVIDVVLPGLVLPRWSFDPENEEDHNMGEALWKRVSPSLRKLRNILSIASKTAIATDACRITLQHITQAYSLVLSQEDQYLEKKRNSAAPAEQVDTPEQRSIDRHKAKETHRKKRPMSRNSFCETGEGTQPLDRELCQRLHYKALEQAMGGCHTDAVPSTVDLSVLRQHSRLFGREAYLYHPESVERLFAGISLGVYRLIVELYCSRLERSMNMVWRIVQALALGAGRAGISYEAVWAVCMHLEEQRRRETEVALEQDTATWWIIPLFYEEKNQCAEQTHDQHMIMCLLDLAREVVLAFRVVDRQHMNDALGLVLYDALVGQRQPYRAAAGLSWHVPERLIVEQGLSQDCLEGCMLLGITCETKQEPPVFFQAIQVGFRREVTNRRLRVDQLTIVFDSYLHKAYDYSPLRFREDRDRIYFHLVGYNRDPAWQCPVLRHFLPLHSGVITDDGTLFYDGLHYTGDLLVYWAGVHLTFRLSEYTEALIWVYLDGSMLCTALARELRRRDGTYWSHRPGRG